MKRRLIAIDVDTLIPAYRKGVDGFSVETAGSGKHPFSPSSDSLTLLGHQLCTNFAITKLFVDYVMHSSFVYRQFNSNFTCSDLTILPYGLIHSRNRGTVGPAQDVASPCCLRVPPRNIDTTGIWFTSFILQ
ncbi:hypothetical protein AVEN_28425-1 [Araneus ventricosus]|uniref:Uncharacterized protein n=1 Tax=Araneus ventricosus TaxID=182803 RepID=A0A4Y2L5Y5_ARAVE|nr:hypothetical protein AVEN_28425-1 [Araneus ventricosus]